VNRQIRVIGQTAAVARSLRQDYLRVLLIYSSIRLFARLIFIYSSINTGKAVILWFVTYAVWMPFWLLGALIVWLVIPVLIRNSARISAIARTPLTPPRTPTAGA
jgi:hypothetical protein